MLARARLAVGLLSCVLPDDDVEVIVGDLEEECASRVASGHGVTAWYWTQLVRSIPSLFWLPIQRGGLLPTAAVAAAACAVQAIVELATAFVIRGVWPTTSSAAFAALPITLVSLGLVSYHATRARPGAATAIAFIAAVVLGIRWTLAPGSTASFADGALVWIIVVPSVAFVGGALSLKVRHR